jgi:hypothetical protein
MSEGVEGVVGNPPRIVRAGLVALAALAAGAASAQPYGYPPQPYPNPAYANPYRYQQPYRAPQPYQLYVQPRCCALPAATEVAVELAEAVGTRERKAGDTFALRLAAPVIVDGQLAIPAGTPGVGHVVQSSGPGLGGKGAKLVVSADYLTVKGGIVPLQGLQLTGMGKDHTFAADMASLGGWISMPLGLVGFAVPGGDIEIPKGAAASAKVARDVSLQPLGAATREDYERVQAVFGQAEASHGWWNIPPPSKGLGQVVFFRAKTAAGFGLWFNVRETGQALGKLSNGAYFIVPLKPGVHSFTASLEPEFKDHLTLKIDPGETYYVEGITTHGAVLGVADLTPSDKAHFDAVSSQLQASAAGAQRAG